MLKKYQYIFVVIFLGSMLFTVFQYVPILEEEIHASKSMNKKSNNTSEKGGSGSDDSGDDDENDSDGFFNHNSYASFRLFSSGSRFNLFHENYSSLVSGITTPPPKI